MGLSPAAMVTFPAPASSNGACGFPALTQLRHLNVTGTVESLAPNQIGDAGLAHLARLHQLTSLTLNGFSDITYQGLENLLGGTADETNGSGHAVSLPSLIDLDISYCRTIFRDEDEDALALICDLLPQLRSLGLESVEVNLTPTMSDMAHLQNLNLANNDSLRNQHLTCLSSLTQMTRLSLDDCPFLTNEGVDPLRAQLPRTAISFHEI
jgi:hypothetical protein